MDKWPAAARLHTVAAAGHLPTATDARSCSYTTPGGTTRKRPRERLLLEFQRRVGDANTGGSVRRKLMTAYRQDALRCAACLQRNGPTKAAAVARDTGVPRARAIMYADHYGWFERPGNAPRGIYALTPRGAGALRDHADLVARLDPRGPPARSL